MGLLENYCNLKIKSMCLSKLSIKALKNYPKFKSFFISIIVNIKQYKKNLLLFYLIINLMFGGLSFVKKKSTNYLILQVHLKNKKIFFFLQAFINFYLPLLNISDIIYKKLVIRRRMFLIQTSYYRFTYFCFPPIPELDVIYENFELIYDFISNFKCQLDIVIRNSKQIQQVGELLLRFYRFPCKIKLKNN
jgi:hypothetical protein